MYPHAGGDYVYLREAYHPVAGFLAGWLSFFVIYAGTVATLAVGFAEGLAHFVPLGAGAARSRGGGGHASAPRGSTTSACAPARGSTTSPPRSRSSRCSAWRSIGPLLGGGSLGHLRPLLPDSAAVPLGGVRPGALAGAVQLPGLERVGLRRQRDPRSAAATFRVRCSSGWPSARRSIWWSTWPTSTPCRSTQLRGNARVGEAAARVFFGDAGGAIGAALILASIVSCLNATILVGPRIAYAMALDGLFFAGVDRVHAANQTPHVAIAAQAADRDRPDRRACSAFRACSTTPPSRSSLATMADTTALYALRRRQPRAAAPLSRLGLSAGAGAVSGRQRRHRRARCCAAGRWSAPSRSA